LLSTVVREVFATSVTSGSGLERKESEVAGERKDLTARPETERETDRNPTLLGGISDVSLEQVV
jgi:hypothetical protein